MRFAQHVAAAGVAMYVDDEIPGIGVDPGDEFQRVREREWDAMLQAGAFGEELRNRGQRVYVEEPDFEAPPAPPRPRDVQQARGPIPIRDYEEVRR